MPRVLLPGSPTGLVPPLCLPETGATGDVDGDIRVRKLHPGESPRGGRLRPVPEGEEEVGSLRSSRGFEGVCLLLLKEWQIIEKFYFYRKPV